MKKITKETTKLAGRQIGKLTHSSPGCILEYVSFTLALTDNFVTRKIGDNKNNNYMSKVKNLEPLHFSI